MKIVIAGATGLIGKALTAALSQRGDAVVALTRSPDGRAGRVLAAMPHVKVLAWHADPARREPWWDEVDGADAVVNLAGEPLFARRWNDEHKRRVRESRVHATEAVIEALKAAKQRPATLVNASAVGYYGSRDATPLDESAPAGNDFLATLCRDWELAAQPAESLGVRLVVLRTGVVLGEEGGALQQMLPMFKAGLGGPLGNGRQWFPWVHLDDAVGLVLFAIDDARLRGPVNVVSPNGTDNRGFGKALGRVLKRPSWLPAPAFALKTVLGEGAGMVLEGQHAVPAAAIRAGYAFKRPELEEALRATV